MTGDVQDFVNGVETNYGWQIMDETYWGGPDIPLSAFYSKEYGNYIPYLEIEIIGNQPPGAPDINGQTSGKAGQKYWYTFVSVDPDDDNISYQVDWGDGSVDPWDGPHESNEIISKDHIWSEQGEFTIKARAKEINEEIGEWGTLDVTMPMNQNLNRDILTFNPTDDVDIRHEDPNQNFGTSEDIVVRNDYGMTGSGFALDGLIRFDISSIPQGTSIVYATLKLFYYAYLDTPPAGRDLNLYRITSDWDEMSVTWNTQPTYASQPTTFSTVPPFTGVWMEWDVTSDIQDFISGSEVDYGWKITDEDYWGGPDIPGTRWWSKESRDTIPYLEIKTKTNDLNFAFLFGRIENLNTEGNLTIFDAVKLRYLQFSPFSFNTYVSGEEIVVGEPKLGIITTSFAFGFFSAALL
ncbi:MAG: DNRLRE domain-containing protein [Thermoplasmatales archaeon]|nr:MAG: DNRLRE domain-containing protein [Thermoplasmatales archaeon]